MCVPVFAPHTHTVNSVSSGAQERTQQEGMVNLRPEPEWTWGRELLTSLLQLLSQLKVKEVDSLLLKNSPVQLRSSYRWMAQELRGILAHIWREAGTVLKPKA